MRYREVMEKKAGGSAAPKRIIFYRGSSLFPHVYIGYSSDYSFMQTVSLKDSLSKSWNKVRLFINVFFTVN
jgi:hypothetical protein